ncbi:MAG TPA: peptidylprolyl isomerase [Planctomycetota bacterium]|nr:peptidylprolyl isomerase [Planctomycetota bacterium]
MTTATIVAGAFDLHRRYRSMEGPYVSFVVRLGDLFASKSVSLPEGMVRFVEGGGAAPLMAGGASALGRPLGSINTTDQPPALYWLKGLKVDVLDENDQPAPTAEFVCHYNLDVAPAYRNQMFPQGERCVGTRIATLTQGQTEILFPEGYAVPVASSETWSMVFQAANRTTDAHRRVKHRCTMYFIKDSDLVHPVTALHWYTPYVTVVIDKASEEALKQEKSGCPSCLGMAVGVNAPNNTANGTLGDRFGQRLSGHWVVPPGERKWATVIGDRDFGFAVKDRVIHAVWSHVHPMCAALSLYRTTGPNRELIFCNKVRTRTHPGLEVENIEFLSSKAGIPLPRGATYELEATYSNTTDQPLDSMAVAGIFFEDPTFARPDWVSKEGYSCMAGTCDLPASSPQITRPAPPAGPALFNLAQDGPLLAAPRPITLNTNAGIIHLQLDPSLAPKTCTQLARLFDQGAFNGTRICRHAPGFVLQVALAQDKAKGYGPMPPKTLTLLRRIPLEVPNQKAGHERFVLSMARDSDPNSAISSFSILLGPAPHLDGQYTVFGRVLDDEESRKTIETITGHWKSPNDYWIEGAQ